MSLEEALNRLADVVEEQTTLLTKMYEAQGDASEAPAEEAKEKTKAKGKTRREAEKPKADAAAKKKKAAAKKEEPKAEDVSIHELEYYKDTVQPKTKEAAKTLGRGVVMGILDEFGTGLETARDLEQGQWEDYVARLDAELAGDDDEDDLS